MNNQELLTKLREAIPGAANGQKELLKEVGLALKTAAERVSELESEAARLHTNCRNLQSALEETPLPDAPGSINFKMADPACKVVGQFTFRFHTPELAIERFPALVKKLLEAGLVSEDEYIDQRRAVRAESQTPPRGECDEWGAGGRDSAVPVPWTNEAFDQKARIVLLQRQDGRWFLLQGKSRLN